MTTHALYATSLTSESRIVVQCLIFICNLYFTYFISVFASSRFTTMLLTVFSNGNGDGFRTLSLTISHITNHKYTRNH